MAALGIVQLSFAVSSRAEMSKRCFTNVCIKNDFTNNRHEINIALYKLYIFISFLPIFSKDRCLMLWIWPYHATLMLA